MKLTIVRACFLLLLADGVILAQDKNAVIRTAKADPVATAKPTGNFEDARGLRKQQLQDFREHVLTRTLGSIKNIGEPALRISIRNQVLTYLAEDKNQSAETKALASKLAVESLDDFAGHADEISPFMADYLLSDLGAWIEKYQADLKGKLKAVEKIRERNSEAGGIRSLLELEGGEVLASRRIRQLMEAGSDVEGLVFYLEELRKRNSTEFEPLLSQIVVLAERGPAPGVEALSWVVQTYLNPQVSKTIKQRFLSMVLARTQTSLTDGAAPRLAYDLLLQVLPAIRELRPELYEQALTQSFVLRTALSESELASEARAKRLRKSLNPIEDLLEEADTAKSKTERNELLMEAAQLALNEKKLSLCLELVARIDLEVSASLPDFWRARTDGYLQDFVKAALGTKNSELAEKGADRITSPLERVEGLARVIAYLGKSNDKTNAQRLLSSANKIASAAPDRLEKAKAFFLLSRTCDMADESQKAPLLERGINALNGLSRPDVGGGDKKTYQEYVRSLDNMGNDLRKTIRALTKRDENSAIALTEQIQKPDLRPFATIGILEALDEMVLLLAQK